MQVAPGLVECAPGYGGQLMHHQPDDEIQPAAGVDGQGDEGEIGADRAEQDSGGLQQYMTKLRIRRHGRIHHQQVNEIVFHASQSDAAMSHDEHAEKDQRHCKQGGDSDAACHR
ncbi:hypothetical protein D3C87_1784900 [compost metagenome]